MAYQAQDTVGGLQRFALPRPSPLAQQEVMGTVSTGGREPWKDLVPVPRSLPPVEPKGDIYLLSDEEQAASDALLEPVYAKYPKMRQWGFRVKDSRGTYSQRDLEDARRQNISPDDIEWPGALEFYHPRETGPPRPDGPLPEFRTEEFYQQGNPFGGGPTIELFEPVAKGNVTKAIMGDMLHYLKYVDPEFVKLREDFRKSIYESNDPRSGEKQIAMNWDVWARSGDKRSFNDWFEATRLDAYIRGRLYPDERDDWKGSYTEKQESILKKIKAHVEAPAPDDLKDR